MRPQRKMPKKAARPYGQRCIVCGKRAEVSHPDGKGDQTYYCGLHEPNLTIEDEIERMHDDLNGPW